MVICLERGADLQMAQLMPLVSVQEAQKGLGSNRSRDTVG